MNEFEDFLDPATRAELTREFGDLEIKANPFLAWRMMLGQALTSQGFICIWGDDDSFAGGIADKRRDYLYLTNPDAKLLSVPIVHLEDLFQQGAPVDAVALYLKAVSIDGRFKLWRFVEDYEEEDE